MSTSTVSDYKFLEFNSQAWVYLIIVIKKDSFVIISPNEKYKIFFFILIKK